MNPFLNEMTLVILLYLRNGSFPFCAKKCRLIEKISVTRAKNFKLKLKNVRKSGTKTFKFNLSEYGNIIFL